MTDTPNVFVAMNGMQVGSLQLKMAKPGKFSFKDSANKWLTQIRSAPKGTKWQLSLSGIRQIQLRDMYCIAHFCIAIRHRIAALEVVFPVANVRSPFATLVRETRIAELLKSASVDVIYTDSSLTLTQRQLFVLDGAFPSDEASGGTRAALYAPTSFANFASSDDASTTEKRLDMVRSLTKHSIHRIASDTPLRHHPEITSAMTLVIRELVDNIMTHASLDEVSGIGYATIAYTHKMPKTNFPRISDAQAGPHSFYRHYGDQGIVELLVGDTGIGVFESVNRHLGKGDSVSPSAELLREHREPEVLRSVLSEGIKLKRGRESTGLQQIRRQIATYGGMIWCQSNGSSVQLSVDSHGSWYCEPEGSAHPLPGTLVHILLPCPSERAERVAAMAASIIAKRDT